MQWVILAASLISAAASAAVLALLCAERRFPRGAGEEKERGAGDSGEAEPGGPRSGAESAELLRARLAERRFSEGVMNVLNYENPAGKGNGA